RGQGRDIMPAHKALRSRTHGGAVERLGNAPGTTALKGEVGPPIDDAVPVMALDCREPRIEIRVHLLGGDDRNRVRPQMRIESVAHGACVPIPGQVEMANLAQRMYPGGGAASARYTDLLTANARDRRDEQP